MPPRRVLTEEQCGDVVGAYLEGATIDELAEIYGCSISPIRQALMDAGVEFRPTGRPWPYDPEVEQRIVARYLAGSTIERLVADHGGTNRTLRKVLERHDVPVRSRGRQWPYDESTERRVAEEYAAGATIRDLVARHGGTDRSVRRAILIQGGSVRSRRPPRQL